MIDKLIIDGVNIELTEKDKMPYNYNFSTAKTHTVKYALSDTNEISAGAFANCTYMTKVKFPPEIKMIKRRAFENCSSLNNVIIPATIEYIGANVWDGCKSMTEISFESTTPPSNFAKLPAGCKAFIPNDSKYSLVEGDFDLDNEIYYERTFYNMYNEVPKTLIDINDPEKKYYRDNWTVIADNSITIEEKNRIPVDDIQFDQNTFTTNVAGDKNTILTVKYKIMPENATNRQLYFTAVNNNSAIQIIDTEKEGEILIECQANKTASADFRVYAESGINTKFTVNTIK